MEGGERKEGRKEGRDDTALTGYIRNGAIAKVLGYGRE